MNRQPQKMQSIQKTFHFIRICRAFFTDHFVKKPFWISLRNAGVIVKILSTVKYRVSQNVCNIVCFANICRKPYKTCQSCMKQFPLENKKVFETFLLSFCLFFTSFFS